MSLISAMRRQKPKQTLTDRIHEFIAFKGDTHILVFLTESDKIKFSMGKPVVDL